MAPPDLKFARLEKPDDTFIEDAVDIFVSLMKQDPLAVALTGTDASLLPMLCRVMLRGLVLTPGLGEAYAATDASGALAGFLVFSLPGQLLFSTETSRAFGFYDYAKRLSEQARKYFLGAMAQLPPDPNVRREGERAAYWCNMAFVRKEWQGQGVATALFGMSFKRAAELKAAKMGLIATDPGNLPIYKAIGYQLTDHKVIQSPWNEYNLWFFARDVEID
ncbi:hypothetical protein PsYK624_085130 [Phanerochaete sordida]|uniref:N-acetyltransferase domain-containing protein n=1 Tax=Phanerochaete sordida TaxID=48140 RepID=A0A9P3GEP1_9APHY|nr:hypothetical protein PsYK624_085130 [Phanerochaete sordida]